MRGAVASTSAGADAEAVADPHLAGPKLERVRFSPKVPGAGVAPSSPAHQA